jgi:4-carboxymuconolactone decarboxylase
VSDEPRRPPRADRAAGTEKMQDVYGFTGDPDVGPGDFLAYTVDHLFGDVWCRPGLDTPARRLLTIGVLAAQGQPDLIDLQFDAALEKGELTEQQVREVVIHLAHYVGWPLGAGVNNSAERVIARRNKPTAGGS